MLWWNLKQLKAKSLDARKDALRKLGAYPNPKAWEALVGCLQDSSPEIRETAAQALASHKSDSTIAALTPSLRDAEPAVREAAVQTIRIIGSPAALHLLVDLLLDESALIRSLTAKALQTLRWKPESPEEHAAYLVATGDVQKAAELGTPAFDPLALALENGSFYQRQAAIDALASLGDDRVINLLLKSIKDPEEPVRTATVEALRQLAHPLTLQPLTTALKDPSRNVRTAAAQALGQLNDPQTLEPLTKCLTDQHWEVREAALVSLGRLEDPKAVPQITESLADDDREVREAAAKVLGQIGDPKAIGPLIPLLIDREESVRQAAHYARKTIDPCWTPAPHAPATLPQIQEATKSRDYWIRQAAHNTVARISQASPEEPSDTQILDAQYYRRQAAVELLSQTLDDYDSDLQIAALQALSQIGQKSVIRSIRRLLDQPGPVRSAAEQALETLGAQRPPDQPVITRGDLFST